MVIDAELIWALNEAVAAYFKVLFMHFFFLWGLGLPP
jgi:hypothetical protein